MKNIALLFVVTFGLFGCQERFCEDVTPYSEVTFDHIAQQATQCAVADASCINELRTTVYQVALQGGDYLDEDNRCYQFSVEEWLRAINYEKGGPYCGGTSFFGSAMLSWLRPEVAWASVSIGTFDQSDPRGHVYNIVSLTQDDSIVYSVQDFMFNYTVVLRSNPSRVADIRDMKRWANERVLVDKVMVTQNTQPTMYLSDQECAEGDHSIYDGSQLYKVQESGRSKYPYIIHAPRTLDHYARHYQDSQRDETFYGTYQEILAEHGYGDISITNHDNLVYILVCLRAVYHTNMVDGGVWLLE
jgi:hypothetical protein